MLPELSGVEVCRIVRAESPVPILMLTAKDSEVDKVVGLELGADDYVTKPFSLRELIARIRALLRRTERSVAESEPPAAVDLGDVQVDLAGHRILRDGRTVPVKPKAFELLAFLIRHPGQVFTRDQLLEHVWGYDYAGEIADRRRPRPLAAQPDRDGPVESGLPPHRPRRRLRVPSPDLTRRTGSRQAPSEARPILTGHAPEPAVLHHAPRRPGRRRDAVASSAAPRRLRPPARLRDLLAPAARRSG